MLVPAWKKNDRKARWLILVFSFIVFAAVVLLSRVQLQVNPGFDVHIFALLNATINSMVALLLLAALAAVKRRQWLLHKHLMITAMVLSMLFLVSYICHHLLAGETRFGDLDHDGEVSEAEKEKAGPARIIYYVLLGLHIPMAALILPFILFTAYRSMIGEYARHKKLARITWPAWFFVAVSGVVIYWMIKPFY